MLAISSSSYTGFHLDALQSCFTSQIKEILQNITDGYLQTARGKIRDLIAEARKIIELHLLEKEKDLNPIPHAVSLFEALEAKGLLGDLETQHEVARAARLFLELTCVICMQDRKKILPPQELKKLREIINREADIAKKTKWVGLLYELECSSEALNLLENVDLKYDSIFRTLVAPSVSSVPEFIREIIGLLNQFSGDWFPEVLCISWLGVLARNDMGIFEDQRKVIAQGLKIQKIAQAAVEFFGDLVQHGTPDIAEKALNGEPGLISLASHKDPWFSLNSSIWQVRYRAIEILIELTQHSQSKIAMASIRALLECRLRESHSEVKILLESLEKRIDIQQHWKEIFADKEKEALSKKVAEEAKLATQKTDSEKQKTDLHQRKTANPKNPPIASPALSASPRCSPSEPSTMSIGNNNNALSIQNSEGQNDVKQVEHSQASRGEGNIASGIYPKIIKTTPSSIPASSALPHTESSSQRLYPVLEMETKKSPINSIENLTPKIAEDTEEKRAFLQPPRTRPIQHKNGTKKQRLVSDLLPKGPEMKEKVNGLAQQKPPLQVSAPPIALPPASQPFKGRIDIIPPVYRSISDSFKSLIGDSLPLVPVPEIAFGKAKWEKYFGDVGEEPPLPLNIEEILNSPCRFWPGKTVKETHVLFLLPKTINKKPLTLLELKNISGTTVSKKCSETFGHQTFIEGYDCHCLTLHGDVPVKQSEWLLITKKEIPLTNSKEYPNQIATLKRHTNYRVPKVMEVLACMITDRIDSSEPYVSEKWGSTLCEERSVDSLSYWVGSVDVPLMVSYKKDLRAEVDNSGSLTPVNGRHRIKPIGIMGVKKL